MQQHVLTYELWESLNAQYDSALLLEHEGPSFSKEQLFQLVLEALSREDIQEIVTKRNAIRIFYEGDETIGKGWRYIEPYVVGVTSAGNIAIRAFQFQGPSETDVHEGWKLFLLDKVVEWARIGKSFFNPRPLYNPEGDKGMIEIYSQAKFEIKK